MGAPFLNINSKLISKHNRSKLIARSHTLYCSITVLNRQRREFFMELASEFFMLMRVKPNRDRADFLSQTFHGESFLQFTRRLVLPSQKNVLSFHEIKRQLRR